MTEKVSRHQWGPKMRYLHKSERVCLKCGIVKVSRHEVDGPRDLHWKEYWRGLDQIISHRTPPCVAQPTTPAGGSPANHGDVKHELAHHHN